MFKIGEKVVFVGGHFNDIQCIIPQINEIVTILEYSDLYDGFYRLVEYPECYYGLPQHFSPNELRKLKNVLNEQSEEILERILQEQLEPELI